MAFDVVVVGAGPAGLCLARSLAGSGLRIALVERQAEAALAAPADDGREIAITHRSQGLLRSLGLWERLREDEIATLRETLVLDGRDRGGLAFSPSLVGAGQLGWLLPNHAIRRAAFAAAAALPDVELLAGVQVASARADEGDAQVTLEGGETLRAGLLVAADSRHSQVRRAVGIGAAMHDFGKTMLVLRMRHEATHAQVAWEWFAHGQTLALLPLHDPHVSSVVLTLPPADMQALLAQDDAALGADMAARFERRLGAMEVAGPRCTYPLVGVYAQRFAAERVALVGDAAVGMHPVTAHGFNFGLLGQDALANALRGSLAAGRPAWHLPALRRYERGHRAATLPLYLATQALAGLYTDDRPPARALRKLALGAGARLSPFRRMVVAGLTGRGMVPGRA
jgi:ubiquinone biosynthesis UbiH/UbiF/VisC/COQ6 family hydroxylase